MGDKLEVIVEKDESLQFLLHITVTDGKRSAYTTCSVEEKDEQVENLKNRLLINQRRK